jgi:hypothetical protein
MDPVVEFNPDNVQIPVDEVLTKLRKQVSDLSYVVIQLEIVNEKLREHIKSLDTSKPSIP